MGFHVCVLPSFTGNENMNRMGTGIFPVTSLCTGREHGLYPHGKSHFATERNRVGPEKFKFATGRDGIVHFVTAGNFLPAKSRADDYQFGSILCLRVRC